MSIPDIDLDVINIFVYTPYQRSPITSRNPRSPNTLSHGQLPPETFEAQTPPRMYTTPPIPVQHLPVLQPYLASHRPPPFKTHATLSRHARLFAASINDRQPYYSRLPVPRLRRLPLLSRDEIVRPPSIRGARNIATL